MNDEQKYENVFAIPVNYTDSGRFLNGMFETRNAIEAGIVLFVLGYPLVAWLNWSLMTKVIIASVVILPLVILALIGIDGDSFTQYLIRIIKYSKQKRVLHLRRVGYKYDTRILKNKK